MTIAAALTPADVMSHVGGILESLGRICVYAVSIVLEATPFVLAGSIAATLAQRFATGTIAAPLLTAFAPACDCAMNGFAAALGRCTPAIAGMALTWGAVCNPIALIATAAILGHHLLAARVVGGGVAAATIGLLWRLSPRAERAGIHDACAQVGDIAEHLEGGLKLLLPAAFAGSAAMVLAPDVIRMHPSPLFSAIAGALLSPCSTADPVLARVLIASASSQAAFVVASQCADVRQLLLLSRYFGLRQALLAAAAGAAGCIAAIITAR